jgi:chemotaxis protein methyltransferase CheR
MLPADLQNLSGAVARVAGLVIRPADGERFVGVARARIAALRLESGDAYARYLSQGGAAAHAELETLLALLVPGESYFFRDQGQIRLIESTLLPELIQERRKTRSLRVWSSGCSTGEEPYTLAMLLTRLLPDRESWNLTILGTDMNVQSLAFARARRYRQWSFRLVPEATRREFFTADGDEWLVREDIARMVRFQTHNLLGDAPPEGGPFDLIVCRNVFIYFTREAVERGAGLLARSLVDGGYLVTGHGELTDTRPPGLAARVFPEAIVLKKAAADGGPSLNVAGALFNLGAATLPAAAAPSSAPAPPPPKAVAPPAPAIAADFRLAVPERAPSPSPSPAPRPASVADGREAELKVRLRELRAALHQRGPAGLVAELVELLRRFPDSVEAQLLLARVHADQGQHERAGMILNELGRARPFEHRSYFLLAQIAEEQGDVGKATDLLKRVIYLEAEFAPGYAELAQLYALEGDRERSERMRRRAVELLKALPPGTEIEEYPGSTAGSLLEHLAGPLL